MLSEERKMYMLKAAINYMLGKKRFTSFLWVYLSPSILPPFILHVLLTIEDFRTWPLFAIPEPRNISMILNVFDVLHAT